MTGFVSWEFQDEMLYPTENDSSVHDPYRTQWKESKSPFSFANIKDDEFAFKTAPISITVCKTTVVEQVSLELKPSIKILHEKDDSTVYLSFNAIKSTKRQVHTRRSEWGWGEHHTMHLEVSFLSKDRGDTKGVWQMIKAFAIPLQNSINGTELSLDREELCNTDVMRDYIIVYEKETETPANTFRLELPIRVSMTLSKDTVDADLTLRAPGHQGLNSTPMNLMRKLLSESLCSDFSIHVGESVFPCHKNILAGQSEVFAAMFYSNMTEANSKRVEIEDMSPAGVKAFLKYLYYQDVVDAASSGAIALELLQAGHKYQIKELELESRSILSYMPVKRFDAKTTIALFEFCGMVKAFKNLEKKAVRVFKSNIVKYCKAEELGPALLDARPEVAAKLFQAMNGYIP